MTLMSNLHTQPFRRPFRQPGKADYQASSCYSTMFGRREGGLDALLHRKPPSIWSQFLAHPVHFLARKIYAWRRLPSTKLSSPVTVVCVSDTHNCQPILPDGDILIHAGDLTQSGSLREVQATLDWMNRQPHPHKVAIAGNHELILDTTFSSAHRDHRQNIVWGEVIYLQDEAVTLKPSHDRDIKIYGSPWTRRQGNWAFQYTRTTDVWHGTIPPDTDILVTHQPPKGHLDLDGFGCDFLLRELWRLSKKPRLHVFGHVHEGHGLELTCFDKVQRRYDDVICKGGVLQLLSLLCSFLSTALQFTTRSRFTTWFVNASTVGGLRDEKRRKPITINT